MQWDDLKIVLALSRKGSVRAAARRLALDHSTVSRRLGRIEEALGLSLFERTGEGLKATAAGERFIQAAQQIEDDLADTQRQIRGHDQRLSGPVIVTAPDEIVATLILDELADFRARYPDIELRLSMSYASADLMRRQADIAIRVTDEPPAHLTGKRVAPYVEMYYASRDYIARLEAGDLREGPQWIGWPDASRRSHVFAESPFPDAPVAMSINGLTSYREALARGLGLGVLPCLLGDADSRLARLRGCELRHVSDVWLLTHESAGRRKSVEVVMNMLSAALIRARPLFAGKRKPA
ncbi:MAG: hypothetical protein CVT81_01455 [Alphaproteobacteria bacterium HGW-Alphaproteobacteria-3]|nr:MAG: hypothetical protein CVT81_01455 [Alphaproteobacteria bacterium HGW-Alphaproteobacteria-3]